MAAAPVGGAGHEYDGVKIADDKGVAPAVLPTTVSIDPDRKTGVYGARMFGCNFDWMNLDGMKTMIPLWDRQVTNMQPRPDYLKTLQGVPLPLCRMAGTDSQYLQWKKAIGPLAKRVSHKRMSWDRGGIQIAGPVEWINSTRQIYPGAEFVWTLNMTLDTPEDARDLAEFFQGGSDTAWGRKRLEYGLKETVKPAIWELGNELDWGKEKMSVDEYIRRSRAIIAAIRQVQPDAVFSAHAATAPWAPAQTANWKEWHRRVLKELGPDLQYLSFHPYYRGHKPEYLLKYMDVLAEDIRNSSNPRIKVFVSEHAKWPPGRENGDKAWTKNWYQTHALIGCLDTAEWIIMMLQRPEIGAMTYHAFCSGPWGMIYRDKTVDKYYLTGIAAMFKLFGMIPYGSAVVATNVEGPFTSCRQDEFNFSAVAVAAVDGKTLYLLLDNRLPATTRKAMFNIGGGTWHLVSTATLTAPDLHSFNTVDRQNISLRVEPVAAGDKFQTYFVPPKSLVLLTLQRSR